MKKNFKLFSTIASLCLAVALMAFGVWAATTASFGITSKVTFAATDVYVQFTADNYKGATVEAALASQSLGQKTFNSYTGENPMVPSATAEKIDTLTDITLDGTVIAFVYKFTVKNVGKDDVIVTITDNSVAGENIDTLAVSAKVGDTNYVSGTTTLKQNDVLVYTISSKVTDVTTSATDTSIDVKLVVAKA